MLILSRAQVEALLDYPSAMEAVEGAYLARHRGQALAPPAQHLTLPRGRVLVMSGFLPETGALATKVVTAYSDHVNRGLGNVLGTVLLLDPETGVARALLDGTSLTGIRTAAANAVGVKYLAREDARVLGLLGSSMEAGTHLAAIRALRPIERVLVYSRNSTRREVFARMAASKHGIPVQHMGSAEEVVRGADIVVAATGSPEPLVRWEWLRPGTHVAVAGSGGQEVDEETVRRAKVVVDRREDALRSGVIFVKAGLTDGDVYAEIPELISGARPGRASPEEITLYDVLGLGLLDAATAHLVYQRAVERGVGTPVEV